ncbi:MAG: FAD-dependent oxidoreductase, partial [Bdellovibrionales bacterium]|nr:FAD-dependent oxidoreductase [Bdellovibrionales bacterium]
MKRLYFPIDQKFSGLKKIFNSALDVDDPVAILQPELRDGDLISTFIQRGWAFGQPFFVRSGGHSYAGFSVGRGLVFDVRNLKQIEVREDSVLIGAGVTLGELQTVLKPYGLTFPIGSCSKVGIAGYLLGGGHSRISRYLGLGADRVQAINIILASGEKRTVSPTEQSDLYWALLGGG